MRTLIVVPTYNEAENLTPIKDAIFQVIPEGVELLVVDDGSPDGTGQIADQIAAQNKRFHVIHRQGKLGLGSAYVKGFQWGLEQGFDAIIEMDADFSHHPRYLKDMLSTLEDADVAIGSRYVAGGGTVNWGVGRKILSRGGSVYSRMILGAPISDFTGGFNGWKRKVLEQINLQTVRSDGYSFQIELKYRAFKKRFQLKEFPIIFEDRKVGQSKMSKKIVFEALKKVWSFKFQSENF